MPWVVMLLTWWRCTSYDVRLVDMPYSLDDVKCTSYVIHLTMYVLCHSLDNVRLMLFTWRCMSYDYWHDVCYWHDAHLVDMGVGLIKWYSTPSPKYSQYIFLGLDPSPPPLIVILLTWCTSCRHARQSSFDVFDCHMCMHNRHIWLSNMYARLTYLIVTCVCTFDTFDCQIYMLIWHI